MFCFFVGVIVQKIAQNGRPRRREGPWGTGFGRMRLLMFRFFERKDLDIFVPRNINTSITRSIYLRFTKRAAQAKNTVLEWSKIANLHSDFIDYFIVIRIIDQE